MNRRVRVAIRLAVPVAALLAVVALGPPARAGGPIGRTLTYQGSLADAGSAPTGPYDFRFTLWDAAAAGNAVSATVVMDDVQVRSGVFSVELDFGLAVWALAEGRWIAVEVRQGASTGNYTALPRQRLTSTPSALQLSLPFLATFGDAGPLLDVTNTGSGSGAFFQGGAGAVANYGVQGTSWGTGANAAGVRGVSSGTSGNTIGVEGVAISSPTGTGLVGRGTATGAYITATGATSTGLYAYGRSRAVYAENTGTGAGAYVVNAGPDSANATVVALNNGSGPAAFLKGAGQSRPGATLRVANLNPTHGMAMYVNNASDYATAHFRNEGSGQILWLEDTGASGDYIVATGPSGTKFWVDGNGVTHTKVLEILGGADLSERFDVADEEGGIAPGSVVCIDEAHEGRLALSRDAYDHRVAGIVSGAGGVKPGMLMGHAGTVADGAHPVALSGRVYCRVTAANGPIRAGDLLTTSDVPGTAMRVDDPARAQGAILGKAMGSLEHGEGLVLVLVGLQ